MRKLDYAANHFVMEDLNMGKGRREFHSGLAGV